MTDADERKLRIANAIDDSWIYSRTWNEKAEKYSCTWDEIALQDCNTRIHQLEAKLINLKGIREELEKQIQKYYK